MKDRRVYLAQQDPNVAYYDRWLWVPRRLLDVNIIRAALTLTVSGYQGEEETIRMWRDRAHHIGLPRHFLAPDQLQQLTAAVPIENSGPSSYRRVLYNDYIKLRDYQEPAFQAAIGSGGGVLVLSCGKGKTVIGVKLIPVYKVPTLIVAPNDDLLKQWRAHLTGFDITDPITNEVLGRFDGLAMDERDIGWITGKKQDWEGKMVVLSTIQYLSMYAHLWNEEFRNYFGLILFDEVHHLAAPQFGRAAPLFPGVRFGFSATPDRADGLESYYYYHLGPPFYVDITHELDPDVWFLRVDTRVNYSDPEVLEQIQDVRGEINYPRFRNYLARIPERNEAIIRHVNQLAAQGRKILVLSHSKDHVHYLAEQVPLSVAISGRVKSGQRIDKIRRTQVTFATFNVAEEGLDDKNLDTVVFATPFGNKISLVQGMGRALRECDGKQSPLVVVIEDWLIKRAAGPLQRLRHHLVDRGVNYSTGYDNPDNVMNRDRTQNPLEQRRQRGTGTLRSVALRATRPGSCS